MDSGRETFMTEILPFINKAKCSEKGGLNSPFYTNIYDDLTNDAPTEHNPEVIETIDKLAEKYNLPIELRVLYSRPTTLKTQMFFENMVFMSLDDITRCQKSYEKHSQTDFIDIAFQYRGMGHITAYSWHKVLQCYVSRPDGGANDYERIDYFKKYIKNKYSFPETSRYNWKQFRELLF
jgi:hypothetical protein